MARIVKTHHESPLIKEKDVYRTAVYCRVSTLHEDQADSLETQQAYYRRLITKSADRVLVGIYSDSMSGLKSENRVNFQRMMDDCRNGKVDLIITRSVSRFSRNMSECLRYITELRTMGIPVIFEKEHVNSMDANSELFLSILATMAQEESNHISMNIRWANNQRNQLGIPGRMCSYGYRKEKKQKNPDRNRMYDRKWQIYEPEARRVRLAFEMASKLARYDEILSALNTMERAEKTGVEWLHARLYHMLTNEAYRGDILTNKNYKVDYTSKYLTRNRGEREQFYIEEHHEPIVSPEIFDRVNRFISLGLLRSNRSATNEKYLQELRKHGK